MTKPWIIYTRVSSEDQTHGVSLEVQESQCRAMATAHGSVVREVVVDDASGKNLKRTGIRRVLAAMEAREIGGVLIWKLDRLTRRMRDLVDIMDLIERSGVALVSLHEHIDTSGPMGRFTLHLLGSLAQLERETISQRVKAAVVHLRGKGCWTGGVVPPGCRRIGTRGNYRLEADPATAPVVRQVVASYLDGLGLKPCAKLLRDGGLYPTLPSAAGVAKILRSPWLVSVGIISPADAQRLETALRARTTSPTKRGGLAMQTTSSAAAAKSDRIWPLSGLAFCGRCGSAIIGASAKGREKTYHYLRCCGRNRRTCDATDLPAEAWESAVVRKVLEAASNGDWMRAWGDYATACLASSQTERNAQDALQTQLNANRAAAARVLALVEGGAPLDSARDRLVALDAEAKALRSQIDALGGARVAAEMAEADRVVMADRLADAVTRLPTAGPDLVREILSGLVKRVILRDEPAQLTIELVVPRTALSGGSGFVQVLPVVDQSKRLYEPESGPRLHYDLRQVRRGQGYVVEG